MCAAEQQQFDLHCYCIRTKWFFPRECKLWGIFSLVGSWILLHECDLCWHNQSRRCHPFPSTLSPVVASTFLPAALPVYFCQDEDKDARRNVRWEEMEKEAIVTAAAAIHPARCSITGASGANELSLCPPLSI